MLNPKLPEQQQASLQPSALSGSAATQVPEFTGGYKYV
jgi:hypothetical protein